MPHGGNVVERVEGVECCVRSGRVDAVLRHPHAIRPVDAKSCGVQRVANRRHRRGVGDDRWRIALVVENVVGAGLDRGLE